MGKKKCIKKVPAGTGTSFASRWIIRLGGEVSTPYIIYIGSGWKLFSILL